MMFIFFIKKIEWIGFTNFKHWSSRKILINQIRFLIKISFFLFTFFKFVIKSSNSASVLHAKAYEHKKMSKEKTRRKENFILKQEKDQD